MDQKQNLKDSGGINMMKKTHVTAGVTLSSIVGIMLGYPMTLKFLVVAAIGALFSDVDHPKGSINQKVLLVHNLIFKTITYLGFAAILYIYGPKYMDKTVIYYTIPIFIAIAFSRHRSITHSILGCIGMVVFLKLIKTKYQIDIIAPFVFGMVSHIVLDMFNPEGVELLWPNKKNYRFPITVRTGGDGEKVLVYMFAVIVILIFKGELINLVNNITFIHLI